MLHKKFKSSKCKTTLNLAKSRIKLLKNKKDIQVKQLRRELAQLLESGQDQTARIRVEHVVREEKTMAAFELIEIYCELVVARLPILESQKDCPLDLKEAIASLIFAAPRCGDIPELQDVRKHFTAKYGKEFVAAATEVRPNCGVSRNLVEKLSVKTPDGPTKVKILTAIAEEHNIKWEPRWFEGENTTPSIETTQKEQHMEKVGYIQMEPLNFEIADNVQHSHAHDGMRSKTSQSHPHVNIDVNEVSSSISRPHGRPGSYSDTKAFIHSSGIAKNAAEAGGQHWMMEFEDAAAAAQAAAKSAERASMAARAAAELSRLGNIVTEDSSRHDRNDDKNVYAGTVLKDKHVEECPANSSFNQRSPRIQVDQVGTYQQGNMIKGTEATSFMEDCTESGVRYGRKTEEYCESKNSLHPMYQEVGHLGDSLASPSAPEAKYDVFESPKHQSGNVPVNKPFGEETAEMKIQPGNLKSQSCSFGDEYGIFSNLNERYNKNYSDNIYYNVSSHGTADNDNWNVNTVSHSGMNGSKMDRIFSDRWDEGRIAGSDDQNYGFNSGKDIFVSMDNSTHVMDDTKEIGAHTDGGVVFDPSDSDDDECLFDPTEKSYDLPSPGKSSPKPFSFHQDSKSSFYSRPHCGLDVSESFRESPLFKKLSEPLPVKFDSDDESSGSEKEVQNEKPDHVILCDDDGKHINNPDVSSEHEETQTLSSDVAINQTYDAGVSYTCQPSYVRTNYREEPHDLDHTSVYNVIHDAKSHKPLQSSRLSSQSSDPVLELENETQAGQEDGMELNFGLLPSGRRNRQLWDPPYRRGAVGNASSWAGVDGVPNAHAPSSEVGSKQISQKTSHIYTHFDSTSEDPEVVITKRSSNSTEMAYSPTIHETVNRTWKDPTGYFYFNDGGPEDDTPEQPAMSRNLPVSGLSRRTKGSAARAVASSQPSATSKHIRDSSSYASEVAPKLQSETVGSRSRHTNKSRWDEPATSRLRPQSKMSYDAFVSSSSEKQMTPNDTQTPSAADSNEKAPSRENSTKKPGHVHPKLPDFETVTAHMQSLRTNRQ